jgi:hypothetical protein
MGLLLPLARSPQVAELAGRRRGGVGGLFVTAKILRSGTKSMPGGEACPVRLDCLGWAVEHKERDGIWSGSRVGVADGGAFERSLRQRCTPSSTPPATPTSS